MRRLIGGAATLALAAGIAVTAVAPAQAASSYCVGSSYSGRCYTASTVVRAKKLVESVPMVNTNKTVTVTANCEFEKSVTYTQSVTATMGGSVSASVKAGVFASVDVAASYSLSGTLSQSATSATRAGGSFTLKPGQKLTCNRYYYSVTAKVKELTYTGGKTSTRYFTTKVPSSFGITFS